MHRGVEGSAISVSATWALPENPPSGFQVYAPLGGDGKSAPFACWVLSQVEITGDATGGTVTLVCEMDQRYSSLVGYVNWTMVSSAAKSFKQVIESAASKDAIARMMQIGELTPATNDVGATTANNLWTPPPVILPGGADRGQIRCVGNNGNQLWYLDAVVYLFDINVRQITPMAPLLAARGSN